MCFPPFRNEMISPVFSRLSDGGDVDDDDVDDDGDDNPPQRCARARRGR